MNYHQILSLCIRFLSIRMVLFSLFLSFRAKRSILFEIFNSNQNDKQNNSHFKKNFELIKLLPAEFHLISFLYNCNPPSHEFQKILSPQKFGPRIATAKMATYSITVTFKIVKVILHVYHTIIYIFFLLVIGN